MKRILIVLLLVFTFNLSYVEARPTRIKKSKLAEFKSDNLAMLDEIKNKKECYNSQTKKSDLTIEEYIINNYNNSVDVYKKFLKNKNNMQQNSKYAEQLIVLSENLNISDYLYNKILKVENKYNLNKNVEENYFSYYYTNYLKKYKINSAEVLPEIIQKANDYQLKIVDMRQEIIEYSIQYEQKHSKKIANLDMIPYFASETSKYLNCSTVYASMAKVIQILPNGVLAKLSAGNGPVIFIQLTNTNNLRHGDVFSPFIPLKYMKKFVSYKNIYGEILTAPVFKELLPAEYKAAIKNTSKFYFYTPDKEYANFSIFLSNDHIGNRGYRTGY